ncbi:MULTISPECIES: hypothetical protein [Staphylococcus]|uniref:Uncharacterized protein n=1 Tax=Staphylococcus hsinchuensis TaxID=3051183 RepID=A0ABZ3EB26_9STAP|nr:MULTISPECIES: hypothetical protein [unclassified Staphylococcus]
MQQVKLMTVNASELTQLEQKINEMLGQEELSNYKLLDSTINQQSITKFSAEEQEFNAILTFVKEA